MTIDEIMLKTTRQRRSASMSTKPKTCHNACYYETCHTCLANPFADAGESDPDGCDKYDPGVTLEAGKVPDDPVYNMPVVHLPDTIPQWMLEKHAEIYMQTLREDGGYVDVAKLAADQWLDSVLKRLRDE